MPEPNLDELTSVTLTRRERAVIARGIAALPAIAAIAGQELTDLEVRELMHLWGRIAPEGVAL